MSEQIRILTPAQYIKHAGERNAAMARKRSARWWIKASTGLESGPFIEEADARLTLQMLRIYREDLGWELTEKSEDG